MTLDLGEAPYNVACGETLTHDLPYVNFYVLEEANRIIRRGLAFGIWRRNEIPEVRRRQRLILEAMPDALARLYDIRVEQAAARDAARARRRNRGAA